MFLSKNAKRVLKYCSASESIPVFETNDMAEIGLPESKIRIACEELADEGFATIISRNVYGDIQFYLTRKGKDYKTHFRLTLYETLIKGVLVPIIVALITSIATSYIGWKWGHSQEINVNVISTPSNAPTIEETIVQTSRKTS